MRKMIPVLLLLFFAVPHAAEDDKPALPKVPRGFDEGRETLLAEADENLLNAELLVDRLFEQAGLPELVGFIDRHCTAEENRFVAARLEIEAAPDAETLMRRFKEAGVGRDAARKALAALMNENDFTVTDAIAWLYARGFNFRVLQRAYNGQRIDSFKARRELRALEAVDDVKPAAVVSRGLWEFNLEDAREERGGHYNGRQLLEAMYALGWSNTEIEQALKVRGLSALSEDQRRIIRWGDPELLWSVLKTRIAERDLIRNIADHYAEAEDLKPVLDVARRRYDTTDRWFRTGGPGVQGVYTGPWPDADGSPEPPETQFEPQEGDGPAAMLTEPLTEFFKHEGDTLTLVVYDDGSGRAVINRPKRGLLSYGPETPWAGRTSHGQMYEGRVSLRGRNALFLSVFSGGQRVAPEEFELSNVDLRADGAFLEADLDDGLNLTPMLLRRVSRLIDPAE